MKNLINKFFKFINLHPDNNQKWLLISLFVSGCGIRCSGCFNKEAWDFCSGKPFGRKEIKAIKKLLRDSRYDGFSILGGEPFDQDNKGLK